MPPLPPTVGERLAKCETIVDVWGIVSGANVDLLIDGTVVMTQNGVPNWGTTFTLTTALVAGMRVAARQTVGGTPSSVSPEVIVGDVELPPPPPRLAPTIFRCANCVYADGMAPGSTLTIFRGDTIEGAIQLAQATAGRDGSTCFGPGNAFTDSFSISGVVNTCGVNSAGSPLSQLTNLNGPLPAPIIRSPIFGCQTSIIMDGLTQGAGVEVFADHVSLGGFCSCWGAVNVNLGRALNAGEGMSGKQTMINVANNCNIDGVESTPLVVVIPPDERIKPAIRPVLYDGDRMIRVTNQITGGRLTVLVRPVGSSTDNNVGDAGSSEFEEIALNDPLLAGQIVRVQQTLCSRTETSDPLTVQPRPGTIPTPVVREPLYSCGVLVAVDGVLTGAQVRVFQNGFLVGFAWADGPTVTVRIGPSLVAGKAITAGQRVGGVDSALSAPVTVLTAGVLPVPVIQGPLVIGNSSVQVNGVVPGAYVQVFDRGVLAGTADAVEATVTIGLNRPIDAASDLRAIQTLCGNNSGPAGPGPTPISDPSSPGPFTPSSPGDTPGTPFNVPPTIDGGAIGVTITGELTFPVDPGNPNRVDPNGAPYPLVVMAHGNHRASSPSYQGYRYLGSHLASQGMIFMSINLNDINGRADLIDARGLVILEHIRVLLQRNATAGDLLFGAIDPNRIGIAGHSRGAEGVVDAQVQNLSRPPANRFNIRGVIPIAPTNSLNRRHAGAPLFVIYGSFDADVDGSDVSVNPFFIYDHADAPKAMCFIHHARHNGFNEVWVRPGEENEFIFPAALSPAEHQAIAKAYINAFFQSTLFGRTAYDAFIQGPIRPPGLAGFSIHNQFRAVSRAVVDNFGDADAQLSIPAAAIQRETNTLNQTVSYTQSSMTVWFDAEMRTVSNNPHDSRGVQLAWSTADTYVSNVDARDFSGFTMLSLRLGQQFSPSTALNPNLSAQDLLVKLKTSGGDAIVRVGSITDLPFPDVRSDSLTKAALKTVRIPLTAFTAINRNVRLNQVTGVELGFPLTSFGAISVDDIEFSA